MQISFSSAGDDSDSVRGGKATLTTPPAKEKRKNFFKKPVNDFDESQCLWLLQSFFCVHSSDVVLDYLLWVFSLVVDRAWKYISTAKSLVHDYTNWKRKDIAINCKYALVYCDTCENLSDSLKNSRRAFKNRIHKIVIDWSSLWSFRFIWQVSECLQAKVYSGYKKFFFFF